MTSPPQPPFSLHRRQVTSYQLILQMELISGRAILRTPLCSLIAGLAVLLQQEATEEGPDSVVPDRSLRGSTVCTGAGRIRADYRRRDHPAIIYRRDIRVHRRSGRHHRHASGDRHLPADFPGAVRGEQWVVERAEGRLAVWAPGMWKDDDGESAGQGKRSDFHQLAAFKLVSLTEALCNVANTRTNKWFGESNKLVAGLFSLARKVQPSIVS